METVDALAADTLERELGLVDQPRSLWSSIRRRAGRTGTLFGAGSMPTA